MITGNEPITPLQDKGFPSRFSMVMNDEERLCSGLTIRQYYAGLAMQGIMSGLGEHKISDYKTIANASVSMAEHLIAELNKEKP
jgi:hypothetical protein